MHLRKHGKRLTQINMNNFIAEILTMISAREVGKKDFLTFLLLTLQSLDSLSIQDQISYHVKRKRKPRQWLTTKIGHMLKYINPVPLPIVLCYTLFR